MSRQEAREEYLAALKAGQKNHRNSVLRGRYPYPHVLDEILDDSMIAGRVNLGVMEIPVDQIVGTKTQGRKNAFDSNFMPLLPINTEFAAKWINLCQAHLSAEGIRDPIFCYEYLGRFYVQEGNKRVSVLKHFGVDSISSYVVRLVPVWSQDPEVQRYYEFLHFYQLSQLYRVFFTQSGGFAKLQAALGFEQDHPWSETERHHFLAGFLKFQDAFHKLGGRNLPVTAADALLVWLKVYSFEELKSLSAAELIKELEAVWPDVKVLGQTEPISVQTAPVENEGEKGILTRLVSSVPVLHSPVTVAFINELEPETSTWTQAHIQGARHLEEVMGDQVKVLIQNGVKTGIWAEDMMEWAISQGAQVIFTTTAPLISACRKIAARHPHVKILNCSVSMPYTGVRTYYSRIYEGKFISGAIAGALTKSDRLGYVASYPIFGVPAGINAFALGAQLTNPRAKIHLRWSCLPGDPIQELTAQGVDYISSLDITSPNQFTERKGLSQVEDNGQLRLLASPYWNWGSFYVKIVHSILHGGWDNLHAGKNKQAINYWWGMSSGVIGLKINPSLPEGVRSLVDILQKGIVAGSLSPFHRQITSQDNILRNDGSQWFTPEELLHMDWLCDTVEGSIPSFEELLPRAQSIVRLQGIYRDQILPETGGVLL